MYAFVHSCSKKLIWIAFLLGMVVVLLMPPLVLPHQLSSDTNTSSKPPNRLFAFYPSDEKTDSIAFLTMFRQSKTSMKLEQLVNVKDVFRVSEENQTLYYPQSASLREWIYIGDINDDHQSEVLYVTTENDSVFLNIAKAESRIIYDRIFIPNAKGMFYSRHRFFRCTDGKIYFVLGTLVDKQFRTNLYQYDAGSHQVCLVRALDGFCGSSFCFTTYPNQLLFVTSGRDGHTFFRYNILTQEWKSVSITRDECTRTTSPFVTKDIYPYLMKSDGLYGQFPTTLNSDVNVISRIDVDSLFRNNVIVATRLYQGECVVGQSSSLLYEKNGVLFYIVTITKGTQQESQLFKYDMITHQSSLVRLPKGVFVNSLLYYGDLDENGRMNIAFFDVQQEEAYIYIIEEGHPDDMVCFSATSYKDHLDNCAKRGKGFLFVQGKMECYYLYYEKNPRYVLNFLYKGLIVFGFIMLAFFIRMFYQNQNLKRQETSHKIMQLQLENVQKRIDPHFIFNSLNNLGSLILSEESNKSYDYLSKVSDVLYKALSNREILITVQEELSFCSAVLDTQKDRFKDKFDYEMCVDKSVDLNQLIPSNILNGMADNCIKHGFANIDYKGFIMIELKPFEEGTLVVVEDNGKGRKASMVDREDKKSTGTGLDICHQYVTLFNQKRKRNFLSFGIVDLYAEDGKSKGTRCEFYVPNDLRKEN